MQPAKSCAALPSHGSGRGGVAGGRMEKLKAALRGAAESKDGGRLRDAKKE